MVVVVGLALTAAACSGGGGGSNDDPVGTSADGVGIEKVLQFTGAGGKVHISGTLTLPTNVKGPVPAVLIVPDPGLTNRDGMTVGAPADLLYKDLSRAFIAGGMATYRYDHRGSGASTLDPGQQPTWDDMVTDAQEALKYISQRGEIDGSRLAVVGHDMSGPIALKLAAGDPAVKAVALVAAPGRPLVDVWADQFKTLNGQESSDAFRAMVADLEATGSFPPRDSMRPEQQTMLPVGQDALYKALFSIDPLADARAVKVPVLTALGDRSTGVSSDDANRLSGALGGTNEVVTATNATQTLQTLKPAPVASPRGDPNDMSSMGGGPLIADAPRDKPTTDRMTAFLGAALGARAA
jgi:pimeloyl-ACP methyl ester carboxylesterase